MFSMQVTGVGISCGVSRDVLLDIHTVYSGYHPTMGITYLCLLPQGSALKTLLSLRSWSGLGLFAATLRVCRAAHKSAVLFSSLKT